MGNEDDLRSAGTADRVLLGGRIWPGKGLGIAQALAVAGERVLAIGSDQEIRTFAGRGTKVVELAGRLLVPGFNDAHAHFLDGGFSRLSVDLRETRDAAEFASRIAEHAKARNKGSWILEGNWDHETWPSGELPTRDLIDPVSPDHPVFVGRLDRHLALANSLALRLAGITRDTRDPEGGLIGRDARGEPTGILKDNAMSLVTRVIPAHSKESSIEAARVALRDAARLGVTTIQDNSAKGALSTYRELLERGELTARLSVWRPIQALNALREAGVPAGLGDDWIRLGALKIFADGSLGAGTAALFEPYSDAPGNRGLLLYSSEELAHLVREADSAGYQLAVHAIGDRAVSVALDAFEQTALTNPRRDRRFRIEHAQLVRREDLSRYRALNVIASVQPSHAIDDMRWAEKRIGALRCQCAYNVRSFLEAGIPVALGTDWPVESLDPRVSAFAAVARESLSGSHSSPFLPEERISLEDALDLYTRGSAYAEFAEGRKGTLEPGKLADFVVFGVDLFGIPPREILAAPVEMTVVGGRIVFEAEGRREAP